MVSGAKRLLGVVLEHPNGDGVLEVFSMSKLLRIGWSLLFDCVVTLINSISSLEAFLATDCISGWCKFLAPIGSRKNLGL